MTSSIEPVMERVDWRDRLANVIEQDPLIVSRPSRPAVSMFRTAPRAVYLGVGLCTRSQLSAALPIDLLGMVLPAEAVRRAVGASQLLVLVADAHAMTNHLPPEGVERRARVTVSVLARIARRLRLSRLVVVRASALERQAEFQSILRSVRRSAGDRYHPYVLQQVTDVAYFTRSLGPVVKVGWTLGLGRSSPGTDETSFDRLVAPLSGTRAAYVYCWPGRTLDPARGRAPPYVVIDPDRRVLLHGREDVSGKLARAEREDGRSTRRALRNHLRRLAAGYARVIGPLPGGSVEQRVQSMLSRIFRPWSVC